MKVLSLTKIVLLAIATAGIGFTPAVRAAHATNFLDLLAEDIATRQEDTNNTPAQNRALAAAARALDKNTRTLSADLGAFANAATTLNAAFPDDALLAVQEEAVLLAYSTEAQTQLAAVTDLTGTNGVPNSINNQLTQAQAALDRANDASNSVPTRAKSLAFALNKIRVATMQAHRKYKAPVSVESAQTITLSSRNSQVLLDGDGTYTIGDPSAPDETGTWTYERTGPTTATITLSGGQTADLKFTSPTGGTFSGTDANGNVRGRFTVATE